jgi:hypothetical protein
MSNDPRSPGRWTEIGTVRPRSIALTIQLHFPESLWHCASVRSSPRPAKDKKFSPNLRRTEGVGGRGAMRLRQMALGPAGTFAITGIPEALEELFYH